jgi:hypothetical protein
MSEDDPAPDSQTRNEYHGDARNVIQVARHFGDIVSHPGHTPLRRRIFLAALFAVLIVGTASIIQFKFPFDFESVVADPAPTSQLKTDSSVLPPPSTAHSEPAPSEPKPPPPGPPPVTATTPPSTPPPQPHTGSGPSKPSAVKDASSPTARHGSSWARIGTVSTGDYYDFIAACDGEDDGLTVYAKYQLVDASGFSEYRTVADTGNVTDGCAHVDWRGTQYWARAVAICETPSSCSGWEYIPGPK